MTAVAARRFRLASPTTANALGAVVLVLLGVTVTLAALIHQLTVLNVATGLTIPLIYAAVGVIVARHQPRNPMGWVLIVFVVLRVIAVGQHPSVHPDEGFWAGGARDYVLYNEPLMSGRLHPFLCPGHFATLAGFFFFVRPSLVSARLFGG